MNSAERSGEASRHPYARFLVFLPPLIYLWLRAQSQTPDGLSYALAVRNGADLFHPHHLLYTAACWLIHRILSFGSGVTDAIHSAQYHNILWCLVLAAVAWHLARRLSRDETSSLLMALFLLATRGVAIYSTRVETYLPAMAAAALALLLAVDRRTIPAALALAVAILYHQTNVLLAPSLLLFMILRGEHRAGVRLVSIAGFLVAASYTAAYLSGGAGESQGLSEYVFSYARAPVAAWGRFDNFSIYGISTLLSSQLRMILPIPQSLMVPAASVFGAACLLLGFWHLRKLRRGGPHADWRILSLSWLTVHYFFCLWWLPGDTDFFVVPLLPLWLLAVLLFLDLKHHFTSPRFCFPLVVTCLILLAAVNISVTIWPLHESRGESHARAMALDAASPAEAVIVADYQTVQELAYYSTRAHVLEGAALRRYLDAPGEHFYTDILPLLAANEIVLSVTHLDECDAMRDADYLLWLTGCREAETGRTDCRKIERLIVDGEAVGILIRLQPDEATDHRDMLDLMYLP